VVGKKAFAGQAQPANAQESKLYWRRFILRFSDRERRNPRHLAWTDRIRIGQQRLVGCKVAPSNLTSTCATSRLGLSASCSHCLGGAAVVSAAPKIFAPTDLTKRKRSMSVSCFEFLLRGLLISFLPTPRNLNKLPTKCHRFDWPNTILWDVRQAHLRQVDRGETLVAALPVFCHAAERSQDRKRYLLAVSNRKKRPNPLLLRLEWKGFAVQFRQQSSRAKYEPLPGQGHPALRAA
jgi:hypothetical protein